VPGKRKGCSFLAGNLRTVAPDSVPGSCLDSPNIIYDDSFILSYSLHSWIPAFAGMTKEN